MASLYVIEIDGWGEVGPAIDVTNAEGFADGTFTLTTAGTPPPATEYGAMIWVEDCDAVIADGYYTLTSSSATTFTMQALPADVTVTSTAVTGLARIEDHYKISDSLPSWVTGSNAQARWFRDLVNVSESAGQRINLTGGVASVDGFEFTMSRRAGMAAVSADTYLLDSNGTVVLAEPITGTATTISTTSAAPYAGESTTSPTGTAQPAWFGTEAIDVRGAVPTPTPVDGISTWTATHNGSTVFVTRGVLRTFKRAHEAGVAVYGGMPTPVGQIARAFVYDHGHASHADRTEVAHGACDLIDPSAAFGSAQTLSIASALYVDPGIVNDSARISWHPGIGLGSWPGTAIQDDGSEWKFALSFEYGAVELTRTGIAAIDVDEQGRQSWDYTADIGVSVQTDFPTVRRPPDLEAWERVNLPRVDDEGPIPRERAIVVVSDGNAYVWPAGIDRESRVRTGDPLCHVFFPTTWPRTRNATTITLGTSSRLVEVNPVDVILEILTSTGYGHNGAHDNAPSVFGMAIDRDSIEEASFTEVGNRLDATEITAGSVALLTSEDVPLQKRLDTLLKTYGLAVVTTTSGAVRLVDLAHIDYDTSITLDEGDLVNGSATFQAGAGRAVNAIVLDYNAPWVSPEHAESKHTIVARAGKGGLIETLHRAKGARVSIKPWFAAAVSPTSHQALGLRLSRIIAQTNGVVGTITAAVDPGYSGQIGDTVSVTLPAFPNAQDSGPMSGALCRIIDRIHVSRPVGDAHDVLTIVAYGETTADKPREWAPSGVVDSVTSKLIFGLETSTYSGSDYASDAVSFADGVDVDIYTANWELRSTVSPGTVSSTAGDTVTLSVAAAGGGGDVTPNVGDKITLAGEQNQSVSEAANWGWLSSSTPGYLWR